MIGAKALFNRKYTYCLYPVLIVVRILNEEKVLSAELLGYTDYKKKTKYRLIPFIF